MLVLLCERRSLARDSMNPGAREMSPLPSRHKNIKIAAPPRCILFAFAFLLPNTLRTEGRSGPKGLRRAPSIRRLIMDDSLQGPPCVKSSVRTQRNMPGGERFPVRKLQHTKAEGSMQARWRSGGRRLALGQYGGFELTSQVGTRATL